MRHSTLFFGVAFGFVLSRVGATSYDSISKMFLLEDMRLAGVMVVAIGLSALGFTLVRRLKLTTVRGAPITLAPKPFTPGLALGALLFGVGWSLSGSCPGTALAQLGEGRFAAVATVSGILVASYLVEKLGSRRPREPLARASDM
jgi:uncharacterized membrane protein YedE/YeeE